MISELRQADRADWACFSWEGGCYYGQVAAIVNGQPLRRKEADPAARLYRHGKGIQLYPQSGPVQPRYQGQWHKGRRQGEGHMLYESGAVYEGDFWHDMRHGEGVMHWPDGTTYEGEWREGRFDGQGLFTNKQGPCEGQFRHGLFLEGEQLLNPFTR
jgi:hypothetical protein